MRDLLSGVANADDAFYVKYGPTIYGAVNHVLRNRPAGAAALDADDLAQEVFLRLLKEDARLLRSYDPARAAFSTWLSLVARSTALSLLRKNNPVAREINPDQLPAAPQKQSAEEISPALLDKLLTARQKLVLHLIFDKNLAVEEVARILDVETQTVRSTKHKALEQLRRHFGEKKSSDF
jgi:RNA polymerase sigma-70 factor (ECF subfamily)